MSPSPDLRRLSLLAALGGLGALALGELRDGRGFSLGIAPLLRGISSPVSDGSLIALLCFGAAVLLAAASYLVSLYRIAAGTRLAAALTRDAGVVQPTVRERLRRAIAIMTERRGSAPTRASAAIDELFTPLTGEGVTITRPTPFSPLAASESAPLPREWRARSAQRTGVSGQTDRWATPESTEPEERS